MNICSLVVHAKPEKVDFVHAQLDAFDGVEVHANTEQGKLVVTVEGSGDDMLADTMARFNDVDGVLNSVMIYHYCGDDSADEEVIK